MAHELREETGVQVEGMACHVGDWDAIPEFVESVRRRFGAVHVLVNNAGINPARTTVQDMTLEYWRKLFAVNLEGPLRMSQLFAPVMRDAGGGSIINIATMAAYSGGSTVCAYGASKAALVNLTKSMAQEFAPWNVRVNVLSPGPFLTEMVEGGERTAPGFKQLIAGGTMLKRVADPAEIVGPVLYLASDASSYVTGDDLSVSGGDVQISMRQPEQPLTPQRRGRRIAMTSDERDRFLQESWTCRLATMSADGPHVTPLWFVWDGTALWLNSIVASQRWTDVLRDPRVAVVVDAGEPFNELRGVEMRGLAAVVGEAPRSGSRVPQLADVELRYARKYLRGDQFHYDGRHAWLRLEADKIVSWDFRKQAIGATAGR